MIMTAYVALAASIAGASALVFGARSGEARVESVGPVTLELDVPWAAVADVEDKAPADAYDSLRCADRASSPSDPYYRETNLEEAGEAEADPPAGPRDDCKGRTGVEMHWWGGQVYLNECHTQALIGIMTGGAGGAGICAAITAYVGALPAALGCGVVAGVATLGVGAIIAIDGLGGNNGIIINYPLIGPVTANHQ
ncbi:hypothetical protein [Sorangium sp. So ce542]|uniref:hypothetical protein n=1 Tax=Sorangium sp. So ce542 TaxID=3133316 RepID=UPI003F5F0433